MPVNGFDNSKNKEKVYTKSELDPSINAWNAHVADSTIHVTASDKTTWNAKVGKDADTGKVAKDDLPSDIVYTAEKGAANGVADLDAAARLKIGEAPLLAGWDTATYTWNLGVYTWSYEIPYQRATVIMNNGTAKFYAEYDKVRGTLIGIKYDSGWTFGDVTGQYMGVSGSVPIATTLTADTTGLAFSREASPGSVASISIMVRQDG